MRFQVSTHTYSFVLRIHLLMILTEYVSQVKLMFSLSVILFLPTDLVENFDEASKNEAN